LNLLDLQVSDGSIYPLLARLRTEGKVAAEWVDKGSGHAHKYYTLTPHGFEVLKSMIEDWRVYKVAINRAIGEHK
jgi:PadR family transcriptional regulator PadR